MDLGTVIENIQRASFELIEDNRQHRADLKANALLFAAIADAPECLELLNVLIETVSNITGCASELEDAACTLKKYIESEGE